MHDDDDEEDDDVDDNDDNITDLKLMFALTETFMTAVSALPSILHDDGDDDGNVDDDDDFDDNNDVDANSTNSTTAVNPLREKYRGNHFRFLQTYGIWA